MEQPLIYSHRFAKQIIASTPELKVLWDEIMGAIATISDDDLIDEFLRDAIMVDGEPASKKMSISDAINKLLDQKLKSMGWTSQSALFQDLEYNSNNETRWRLDFSKTIELTTSLEPGSYESKYSGIAVEVAFNHGEAIAWNLLKPVIAGELNHVEKETDIGAGIGVVICASKALKEAGAFDNAVGEYEKFLRYLKPMRNQLTTPMMIVGLEPPKTFRVEKKKPAGQSKNFGVVRKF